MMGRAYLNGLRNTMFENMRRSVKVEVRIEAVLPKGTIRPTRLKPVSFTGHQL